MGTRSRIGVQLPDGSVKSIYCHWDGYLTGVGQTLVDHYQDPQKVEALVALGSLSSLRSEIGEKHDFDWSMKWEKENRDKFQTGGTTDWDALYQAQRADPHTSMCTAYGRDRGETGVDAEIDTDAEAMYRRAADGWEEFAYLYRDGRWFVTEVGGGCGPMLAKASDPDGTAPSRFQPLDEALAAEAAEENAEPVE